MWIGRDRVIRSRGQGTQRMAVFAGEFRQNLARGFIVLVTGGDNNGSGRETWTIDLHRTHSLFARRPIHHVMCLRIVSNGH